MFMGSSTKPKSILKNNNLMSPTDSLPSVTSESEEVEEKIPSLTVKKEILPRRENEWFHYLFAFIGICLLGLLITVLVILDAYAISHLGKHDDCSEMPIVLLIWTILIFIVFFTAIPAGCNGEMNSTCLIGCTEC